MTRIYIAYALIAALALILVVLPILFRLHSRVIQYRLGLLSGQFDWEQYRRTDQSGFSRFLRGENLWIRSKDPIPRDCISTRKEHRSSSRRLRERKFGGESKTGYLVGPDKPTDRRLIFVVLGSLGPDDQELWFLWEATRLLCRRYNGARCALSGESAATAFMIERISLGASDKKERERLKKQICSSPAQGNVESQLQERDRLAPSYKDVTVLANREHLSEIRAALPPDTNILSAEAVLIEDSPIWGDLLEEARPQPAGVLLRFRRHAS